MSEARALFMAGRVAFEEGRYEAALKHFSASYELSAKPGLLYNIAQCHDRLRQDEQAITMFERYLELEPDASNRQAVEARLVVLRSALRERQQTVEASVHESTRAEPLAPRDERRERSSTAVGPWITMGSGVALTASGAVLMTLAKAKANDVENAEQGSTYQDLQGDLDVAERRWRVGQVLVGVGLISACAGVAWWWLHRPEEGASVKLGFGPEALFVTGKF